MMRQAQGWRELVRRWAPAPAALSHPAASQSVSQHAPAQRDVFLLGSAYCGSTHLGGLLEANLDATYAGEVAHLPAFVHRYRLFDVSLGCLRCSADDVVCPRWSPDVVSAVTEAGPVGFSSVLRAGEPSPLVVDGSKWPEWLRQSLRDRPREFPPPVAVVAARSPFGYAMSARGASGEPAHVVAGGWRDVYIDALRTLALFGVPFVVVRNEDIRRNPAAVLAQVARLTGQPEPTGPVRPARPTHSIGGNVYVQHGYREASMALLDRIGLARYDAAVWQGARGAGMAAENSTGAAMRPNDRTEALGFASELMQCPQLVETAQLLGYSMSLEIEQFVAACDGPRFATQAS